MGQGVSLQLVLGRKRLRTSAGRLSAHEIDGLVYKNFPVVRTGVTTNDVTTGRAINADVMTHTLVYRLFVTAAILRYG